MGRVFAQEFKDQIVEVFRQGDRTVTEVAKEFGLSAGTVSNWVHAAEHLDGVLATDATAAGGPATDKAEIARLRRELARKQEELEILGKALAFFAQRRDR
jgi:transposase